MTSIRRRHNHSEPLFGAAPSWASKPFNVCRRRLADEDRYINIVMSGFFQLQQLPDLIETVDDDDIDEDTRQAVRADAAWISKEENDGFPVLHAHAVVGIWSAIEVLAEDFAIAWLRNRRIAWDKPEIAKLKIPLSQYNQLNDDERPRFVVLELGRMMGADLRRGVGKLTSLLSVFGLAPMIGPNTRLALHELCQIRNAVVHCGGLADKKLIEECPHLGFRSGQRIRINHKLYLWYHKAANCFAERVANQALLALKLPGCNCPGAEEIERRPRAAGRRASRR
jgi:hypothetical protein